jgi:predicted TIM-barrel fold metal-dependent hydrolase
LDGIVDVHAHIFQPLAGACGFADAATHLLHQQRSMHVHRNQPYRRARDHALVTERSLWDPEDPSTAGRRDVQFRAGRYGRFEWTIDGEDQYVQFLPPHMEDLSSPAETVVAQMDYAGIATAVLQNDAIYGNSAEDFAAAARAHPGRFIGLAQVQTAFGWQDAELQSLHHQVEQLGMAGLYFNLTALFRSGYAQAPNDPVFDPLWRSVAGLGIPIFWVHSAKSPIGSYEDEVGTLTGIIERHPSIRHVLVHGLPTAMYTDEHDRVRLPDRIDWLMRQAPVWAELLYPISWGGRDEYPYVRAVEHFRQLLDSYGPDRFAWGSDMPNVERYCTYRQALTYVWDHAPFLSEEDRRKIFRENAVALMTKLTA